MAYRQFYEEQDYRISKSNGTTDILNIDLDEIRIIAIENFSNFNGKVFLRDSPKQNLSQNKTKAQPNVIASLEQSLKQNADVWRELSKY